MTAETIAFFYRNLAEDATLIPSTEASTDFAAVNVVNYQLQERWRTSGITGQYLTLDFGTEQQIDTIILWNHNFTTGGGLRVRVADNLAMSVPAYDVTHDAWDPLVDYDEEGYDEYGYDGVPILSDLNGYKGYTIILLDEPVSGRFLRIDLIDPDNADGYLEAGWLGVGLRRHTVYDFSIGNNISGWVDPSERSVMQAGNTFVTKRAKFRITDIVLDFLTKQEAFGWVADMFRVCGCSRPVVVIPYPNDTRLRYRASIYGLIINASDVVPTEQVRQDYTATAYRTTLTVQELI